VTVPGEALPLLVTTVLTALRSGRPAGAFLDTQRDQHLATMRELTRARHAASAEDRLVLDYQIFRIEADLRWIDHTAARLGRLEPEITL
jgi:hypothetical protein